MAEQLTDGVLNEAPNRRNKGWPRGVAVGAILGVTALAVAGGEIATYNSDQNTTRYLDAVARGAEQDGFAKATGVFDEGDSKVLLNLQVAPSCTLNDIEATVVEVGGQVSDVKDYTLTAYAYPTTSQSYDVPTKQIKTKVEGQSVTFTFENRDQLVQDIIGNQPCQALAGALAVQQGVR